MNAVFVHVSAFYSFTDSGVLTRIARSSWLSVDLLANSYLSLTLTILPPNWRLHLNQVMLHQHQQCHLVEGDIKVLGYGRRQVYKEYVRDNPSVSWAFLSQMACHFVYPVFKPSRQSMVEQWTCNFRLSRPLSIARRAK